MNRKSKIYHASEKGKDRERLLEVAVLGGGNGMPAVLRGLVEHRTRKQLHITAIVTSADDGGSSGRIRRERGGLPPGDLRNCLLALRRSRSSSFGKLFQHRYQGAGGLAGHTVGNLILCALREITGDYLESIRIAAAMLEVDHDEVLPVTLEPVHLHGKTEDGHLIEGESKIGVAPCAMGRVWLEPGEVLPSPGVLESIQAADLVVLSPGSLFTSLLPVLLVPGVSDAVRQTRGRRVLVANLMTQPGETLGMDLDDHLDAIVSHVGEGLIDTILVNSTLVEETRLHMYEAMNARLVKPVLRRPPSSGSLLERDLLSPCGKIRHEPSKLARVLLFLSNEEEVSGKGSGACSMGE